jgi:Phytochrome region/GAF domain
MLRSTPQVGVQCHNDDILPSSALLQQFGSLVALQGVERGKYIVIAASDNSEFITGHSPEHLFSMECFSDLIVDRNRDLFRSRLIALQQAISELDQPDISDVFSISIMSPEAPTRQFWCTIYSPQNLTDIWICELERQVNQSSVQGDDIRKPIRQLKYKPTPREWEASTARRSKPLSATQNGQAWPPEITTASFTRTLNEVQSQLELSTSMEMLFDRVVGTVSELTKFDRVVVYQFDKNLCGAIVAECLNPLASEDLLMGLHFRESSIQTRALFNTDTVQHLRNRLQPTASIVHRDREHPRNLDLTRSYLRQVSPDQMQAFSDMDISSSMALALVVRNELWGLIACHSYGSQITPVPPPLREMCRAIGQCVSSQLERLGDKETLETQMFLVTGCLNMSPTNFITASPSSLHRIFRADSGAIVLNGEVRTIGNPESTKEALALVRYFQIHKPTSILASQNIPRDFPSLKYRPRFSLIGGILVIPLFSNGTGFLILFRKQQLMEINVEGTAGNRFQRLDGLNMEPSAGLARWVQYVANTSREWTECQCRFSVLPRKLRCAYPTSGTGFFL